MVSNHTLGLQDSSLWSWTWWESITKCSIGFKNHCFCPWLMLFSFLFTGFSEKLFAGLYYSGSMVEQTGLLLAPGTTQSGRLKFCKCRYRFFQWRTDSECWVRLCFRRHLFAGKQLWRLWFLWNFPCWSEQRITCVHQHCWTRCKLWRGSRNSRSLLSRVQIYTGKAP